MFIVDDSKIPEPEFVNMESAVEIPSFENAPKVLDKKSRRLYIHRVYKLVFKQEPDLKNFPFDYPKLEMTFKLVNPNFVNYGLNVLPVEFQNVPRLKEFNLLMPEVDESECLQRQPIAKVSLVVQRKTGYYVRFVILKFWGFFFSFPFLLFFPIFSSFENNLICNMLTCGAGMQLCEFKDWAGHAWVAYNSWIQLVYGADRGNERPNLQRSRSSLYSSDPPI